MKFNYLFILWFALAGCRTSSYDHIKKYIDTIEIVDTHEHQTWPTDSLDFHFFNTAYFQGDLEVAGAISYADGGTNTDSLWTSIGKYYEYSRTTSYHAQLMYNLKILYGYDKPYIKKEDLPALYAKMRYNHFTNYTKWFDEVYHKANIKTMFQDQHWNRFNTNIDTTYFKLVCNIHECVSLVRDAAEKKQVTNAPLLLLCNRKEILTSNLEDYLAVIDTVLNTFKRSGAVCIKNTLAYYRSLDFENVTIEEATTLFHKTTPLSKPEIKKLEDYVFHHIIKRSIDLDLPIQMHTGYLAGTRGKIDNGHPMKLINLFMLYPAAKFSLFHGGYPWTSDYVALGKQFPNVYLDLVWLPQLSRTAAIKTFHEMLDAVPYNKYFWGGDVAKIDDVVGSLELAKDVVATVLAERMEKGWMDEALAFDIARHIFHDNAVEVFKLDK